MAQRQQRYKIVYAQSPGMVSQYPEHIIADNALYAGNNFVVRNGKVSRANGNVKYTGTSVYATATPTAEAVMGLTTFRQKTGSMKLVVNTRRFCKLYRKTARDFNNNITGTVFRGSDTDPFDYQQFNNAILMSNGVDQVRYWTGTGTTHEIQGSPPFSTAKIIKAFGGYLFAGKPTVDGTEEPQLIYWSGNRGASLNSYNAWNALDVMALNKNTDHIVGMELLRDAMAVYMTNSIYLITKTGDVAAPFQYAEVVSGIGALSRDAIVKLGAVNIFVGRHNVYLYDGATQPQAIADAIQDDFFGTIDYERKYLIRATYSPDKDTVYISRPTSGQTGFTDIYMLTGVESVIAGGSQIFAWSKKTVPASKCLEYEHFRLGTTWSEMNWTWAYEDANENRSWDDPSFVSEDARTLIGSETGYLFDIEAAAQNNNGNGYNAYVQTPFFAFGDEGVVKRMQRIQPLMKKTTNSACQFYVLTKDNFNVTESVNGPYAFNQAGTSGPYIDVDLTSRYFAVKITTSGVQLPWELSGLVLDFFPRSERST